MMSFLPKYAAVLLVEYVGENIDYFLQSRKGTFEKGWYKQLVAAKTESIWLC